MLVSKLCHLTGTAHTIDVPADPDKLKAWLSSKPKNRPLVQDAFPDLDPEYREFLISGIIPGLWDELFKEEE